MAISNKSTDETGYLINKEASSELKDSLFTKSSESPPTNAGI